MTAPMQPSDVEILHLARFHAIDHRYWSQTRVLQFARDVIAATVPAAAVEPIKCGQCGELVTSFCLRGFGNGNECSMELSTEPSAAAPEGTK